ncbi:DUF892 family protein [Rhizobium sp. P32RR-XVIII]|nr:DUF892 family protein [Rhizobium sp. P32RR-XVIII]
MTSMVTVPHIEGYGLPFTGSMAALGHAVAGSEILKDAFANVAFENVLIAAHRSLLTIAEVGNPAPRRRACRQTSPKDKGMAAWLDENLATLTQKFLSLREAGETAKVYSKFPLWADRPCGKRRIVRARSVFFGVTFTNCGEFV